MISNNESFLRNFPLSLCSLFCSFFAPSLPPYLSPSLSLPPSLCLPLFLLLLSRLTLVLPGSLNRDEIEVVLTHLVTTDHGEWLDEQHSQFLVLWDTAQETANAIHAWAQETGKIGDIFTVYEIYAEDDSKNETFHGLHNRCIVKALTRLQEGGRAKVSRKDGEPLDEWGVKFLETM